MTGISWITIQINDVERAQITFLSILSYLNRMQKAAKEHLT